MTPKPHGINMTPFRLTFNSYAPHGHAAGGVDHHEMCPHPEERVLSGNGPVIVYVENGKKLKVPKVIKP